MENLEEILTLVSWLKNSKFTTVLTGAGVSVPSGIPDFRSKNGVYSKWGQEIFDIDLFHQNPDRFYEFAKQELIKMLDVEPNEIHYLLAYLEKLNIVKGVITQNIDNLHKKAGSQKVAEIHGNVRTWSCLKCGKRYDLFNSQHKEFLIDRNFRCECGGVTKPDIVFFGEMLPLNEYSKAENWAKESDVFIAMGTSLVVYPAAQLPIYAKHSGAKLCIVNKNETAFDDYADLAIHIDLIDFAKEVKRYF
ncbi:NAD-dependent protein deacylase [Fervidobacterium sp. 2310opik-2]|uniref:NAD-dependent protein deacylase n=1 Tax=Fervidobacterium sp. 2310opik-2 TaxID=1755815 RepID=UPI001F492E4B|nr:NAD-dependent protein deacylase [Fervidobacterium sp. 2310opik-2]